LSDRALPQAPADTPSKHTLGRLKLIWSYLRSSLPERFFAPQVLRAASVADLLSRVDALAAEGDDADALALRHAPAHDWIYSGEKRPAC
jgi:hypothetical protein